MLVLALSVAGCADLPGDGPRASAVATADAALLPYRLVPITPATLEAVQAAEPDRLAGRFPAGPPPARLVLGIGDVVSIAVYEAAVGGLLLPGDNGARPGNFITLPAQAVDASGALSFPFGGAIRAAGRTTRQVQDAILRRVGTRAIDPQVIVTVVSQQTSLVSVEGEVRMPTRYPAAASGANDRVSDALARAGGLSGAGWDSWVTLERKGLRATVPFEALVSSPAEDIAVQPGDRILVYREPQRFIALGALGPRPTPPAPDGDARPDPATPLLADGRAAIPFGDWRLSLAGALAKAGGLRDARADPASIFLYRREPAGVARRLGLDPGPLDVVPVVFRLDLSDPAGFLLATRFPMRNGDLLYAADARGADVSKAVAAFGTYLGTLSGGTTAAALINSASRGLGTTGLPVIGGLAVVPSGIAGLPGTIGLGTIGANVTPTSVPATGGTRDAGGTGRTGVVSAAPVGDAAMAPLLAPRATMGSPASR